MHKNRKINIFSAVLIIAVFMLASCDNDKGKTSVKDTAKITNQKKEHQVDEVKTAPAQETKEPTAEAVEKPAVTQAAPDATEGKTEMPEAISKAGGTNAGYTIKMLNSGTDGIMVFEPSFLKVEKGATIKFAAVDAGHDTVSSYIPEGASGWKGENSKDLTITLDTEGVYIYQCTPHFALGMVGVIQVGEASNMADADNAAAEFTKTIAVNKNRLSDAMVKIR